MKRRTNVWLDDNDRAHAQTVAQHYGLDSVAAALRFAVNKLARQVANSSVRSSVRSEENERTRKQQKSDETQ